MSDFLCNIEVWNGFENRIGFEDGVDVTRAACELLPKYRKDAMLFTAKHGCKENVLYFIKQYDPDLDIVTTVSFFKDTYISNDEIKELIRNHPYAEFGILYADHTKKACEKVLAEERSKRIVPISLNTANNFVKEHHRHCGPLPGHKWSIGLVKTVDDKNVLIGVAICSVPKAPKNDDGYTLEISRICVTEEGNCCSMLYGACCRIAKDMGYKKVITYTTESEPGISLKASNFTLIAEGCGSTEAWNGSRYKNRKKKPKTPDELKKKWVKVLAA